MIVDFNGHHCTTQRATQTRPQISTRIYGGIPGDHPCGNFPMISLRKFRGNKGEYSMWIFLPSFRVESLGLFPHGNFPRSSHINFKMQFNDIGRVPVMWKHPISYTTEAEQHTGGYSSINIYQLHKEGRETKCTHKLRYSNSKQSG